MNEKLQKTLTAFLGTATLLLIVGVIGAVVVVKNVIAEGSPDKNSITMSAEGKVSSEPDTASVSFSVLAQAKTAAGAQKESDETMKKVIEFIKSNGVEGKDIKTSNYNLYPRYNYNVSETDPGRITGYDLNQRVTVTVKDLTKVSQLVGGLSTAGANQIDTVNFYIDDSDELKAQAREEAVTKAREKAEALAGQLGVKLGKVVGFHENDGGFAEPLPYASFDSIGRGGGGNESALETGTQDISVNVTIIYEIK